ncbi:hypothetical protein [Massilia sp. Leaf139]|nr:hypothetical protein [Massilia sp. Leaf139]
MLRGRNDVCRTDGQAAPTVCAAPDGKTGIFESSPAQASAAYRVVD